MLSRHLVHSSAIEGLDQTLYKGSESAAEADNKKATKSYFLRQCARNRRLARRRAAKYDTLKMSDLGSILCSGKCVCVCAYVLTKLTLLTVLPSQCGCAATYCRLNRLHLNRLRTLLLRHSAT